MELFLSHWFVRCLPGLISLIFLVVYKRKGNWVAGKKNIHSSEAIRPIILKSIQLSILFGLLVGIFSATIPPFAFLAGIIFEIVGLVMIGWGIKSLGENFSECTNIHAPFRLVTVGPYRWVRHPIYSGNLLLVLGLCLAYQSPILAISFLALIFIYSKSSKFEERSLASQFEIYRRYILSTGRFLPTSVRGFQDPNQRSDAATSLDHL